MRCWALCMMLAATGCTPTQVRQPSPVLGLDEEPEAPWLLVREGHDPPRCDHRLRYELVPAEGSTAEGSTAETRLEIVHVDGIKSLFHLAGLSYAVDGRCVFSWRQFDLYDGLSPDQLNVGTLSVSAGDHEVALLAEYAPRQDQPYGFSQAVVVQSRRRIEVGDAPTRLVVHSFDRGVNMHPLERPGVRFQTLW